MDRPLGDEAAPLLGGQVKRRGLERPVIAGIGLGRSNAVLVIILDGLAPASERLRNFVDKAAQATLVGDVFDDAATGQGLLNYFLRGIACGAVTEQEATATGLSLDEIRSKSFVKIMAARRARA